ncbi:hypothetical protein CRYUN_Cryun07bG0000100 [Craigia yunnanensis]
MFTVRSAYHLAREVTWKVIHNVQEMTMIWRTIWKARVMPKVNNFGWKRPMEIVKSVRGIMEDLTLVYDNNNLFAKVDESEWIHPPEGTYKLNVDVVFSFQNMYATLGMVVRNHLGEVQLCASTREKNID